MYATSQEGLYLIPTAEVPVTNLYRDQVVDSLPMRHVAYTPCFRREAGSWGKHVRGLNRLHQFDKVELVQIVHPDEGEQRLEEMVAHSRALLEKLQLPYRLLLLCTGDMGDNAAITYDLEVWSVGQQQWLEVSSISLFGDYQARRMHTCYRGPTGKLHLCHTLNGSALALPRVFAALLEYHQRPNSILLPPALAPYMGNRTTIELPKQNQQPF